MNMGIIVLCYRSYQFELNFKKDLLIESKFSGVVIAEHGVIFC